VEDPQPTDGDLEAEVTAMVTELVFELAPNQTIAEPRLDLRLIEDLEYHSLALLELAFTLEDEFMLDPIDEEVAQRILTARDVVAHVLEQLHARI
jgi:acyl carrier protein